MKELSEELKKRLERFEEWEAQFRKKPFEQRTAADRIRRILMSILIDLGRVEGKTSKDQFFIEDCLPRISVAIGYLGIRDALAQTDREWVASLLKAGEGKEVA